MLRREAARSAPDGMARPQVASRSEVARGLTARGRARSVGCGGKRKLLWQFTVAIKCDPVAPEIHEKKIADF